MVKLKVGRNILDIDENDMILDNGKCYQIITKKIRRGFDSFTPIMSKKLFNDLEKSDLIFTSEGLRQSAINTYGSNVITFWKFNTDKMKRMGY